MAKYRLIAATGCPTGIAHTYMAQEALEQAAKKKGISIKVETHGQVGVENRLTDQEIIEAEAVIIAADKDVQPERFAGKRIIDVSVSKGIKEADQLIAAALNGGKVISEKVEMAEGDKEKQHAQQSIGHSIYKNLMNGVSHMLPFVVSGGVLIAISFLWGIYSADPANAQYNEFAANLNRIGGFAMSMMVPVLSAFIAGRNCKASWTGCWFCRWIDCLRWWYRFFRWDYLRFLGRVCGIGINKSVKTFA